MIQQFLNDVIAGLTSSPKTLPSKYFYDPIGDELFVKIMNLPEYYLTRAEHEILRDQTESILEALGVKPSEEFELVELGAGDGLKTKEILKYLKKHAFNFSYKPIDISNNALQQLSNSLKEEMPELTVEPMQGDYFGVLSKLKSNAKKKVVLFLGSNMGNMSDERATNFMKSLSETLNSGDKLLIGLDLIKPKSVVLPAYNDAQGVTSEFNMNLLSRMNKELDADFNLSDFEHAPSYSEETGIARSAIKSLKKQSVHIGAAKQTIDFDANELIHTEISRKYNREILDQVLGDANFTVECKFTDSEGLFSDWILKVE